MLMKLADSVVKVILQTVSQPTVSIPSPGHGADLPQGQLQPLSFPVGNAARIHVEPRSEYVINPAPFVVFWPGADPKCV